MKKTIQRRISRIAASAVAVAVAVTGIANSKFGNPSVSYAASIMDYDAVSSVNYADILGRGIDYGVVSDQFVQSMHMETTFATNLFTNAGGEQNCDVDLAGDAPAHFIIAEVEDGSQVRFGRTYEGADSVLFNIETTESIKNNNIAYDNVCKADPQYKIDTYDNLKGKVDSIIGHMQDESKRFLSKPAVNIDDIADYKNGKAVIDLTDSSYDNAVVYINIPEDSAIGNNLKGAEVLNIVKNSNTVIVFNVLTPNKVTLPQYTMTIADYDKAGYDFEVDGELKDGKLTFNSTTTHSGEDSIHNRIVDKEMCQKVIWNIPNSKEVAFDTTAGTFLLPNPETYAYTVGSSAGWVASAGKTEVRGGEWHYIYHGRSEDGFDKNKSSFHFASYKTFTNKFNGKNTEQIDNIYAGEGEFTFSFTETESDYKTTVKNYENVSTDKNGRIIFPSLSFAAKEIDPRNPEMHYYVIKEVSMKDKDSKITLSKGEIDIALKVVNNNGVLSYYVSSVKYLTNKHDSNDIAAVNEDVNMSGIEFGLGGFFNLYDLKTSEIDITKKISTDDLNSFNNKYKNEKYKVAIKKGDLYVQNNEGGLALSEHYFEVMSGETVHVSGLVPGDYKVIEAGENLVDYKLDNIEYKINGQSKDSFTVNSDGSKVNAEVVNTYKKLDTDNKALLEVYKETKGLPTSYSNKEFEVAVVANVANGPVKYVQNANGDLGDQPVYFKIKALETISFAVPKTAKNYQNNDAKCTYQVIEKKAEIDGYKWSTTYSNRGEEVITDAVDVKDIDNATKVSLLNTYSRETGNLTINKSFKVNGSDMTNDKAFANAKFIISGPEDFEKVEVSYADFKGGSYTLNNIPLGQYTVTETNMKNSAPDGYGYVTTRYNTGNSCTLNNNNKNGEIGITNEYRKLSSLAIRKTVVTESGSKVTKNRFKLAVKNNSGKYYDPKSGEFTSAEIVYFTVNVDEDYVIKNIPEGSYTITEDLTDAAVDGYKLTTNGIGTGVYVSGNATANVTNTYSRDDSAKTYTLNLKKKAIDAPYSDTVYEIAVKKGNQYLVANGDLVSEPYFFKLTNDEEIKLTLRDAGPYTIVEKTENVSENDNFTLETLYEVDGKVVANGAFSFSNSKTKVDAVVRNNYEHIGGPETGEFEIVKVNSKDNGINLEGATYGLYLPVSESDEDLTYPKVIVDGESCYQVDIKTTNYDGVVKFENVFADKNYIVKELETVGGYYLSEDAIKVSVAVKNGKSTVSIENNGNGIAKLSNGQVLWLENEIIIEISKINRGGDLLAGAILHIEDEDENIIVDSIKTNDNGVITISGKDYSSLVAGRKYYLVEDKAPNGYVIADPVEFEIGVTPKVSTSGKINPVKVNMIDDEVVKTAKLELNKTIDGENITEDDLKNLKFTVQDDGGKYLYKDSEGNVKISKTKVEISLGEFDKDMYGMYSYVFEDVEFGEYTITETQANIEGYDIKYVKMNGQEVKEGTDKSYSTNIVLTRAGKTLWIEDAYKVQTGDLELTKTIDGKNVTEDDLENLKFTVQNEAGEYLSKDKDGKVVTSKEKVEIALGEFDKNNDGTYSLKFEDIEVGKYTVKETQANIEGYDIEYVEMDGKKVNASEDKSFTSTTVVTKDGKVIEIVDAYKAQTGDLELTKT
ncbi:Cna protein B-type domain-containing protein, partial [Eubacterium uniforme]